MTREQTKEQVQERKSWQEMSNAEKKESFDKYAKFKLFEAQKTGKADWQKDMSKEEVDNSMPYNASNGGIYSGQVSMLLRAEMAIKGYEKAQFVTMEQGNMMGGTLKFKHDEAGEIEKTKNGKEARVDGVKMLYISSYEMRPKLDENGKEIKAFLKDKDGKEKTDPETGKPITYVVKEKIPIKPRLETKTLYHVSQFDGLDQTKIKERDLAGIKKYRDNLKKEPYEIKVDYGKELGISGNLEKQLNHLNIAQIKGIDYFNPAQKLDISKEEQKRTEKAQTKKHTKQKSKDIEQGR